MSAAPHNTHLAADPAGPVEPSASLGALEHTSRLLDAAEVAGRLGVPESWVRSESRRGALPHLRLGRYVRYRWPDVEAYLATCERGPAPGKSPGGSRRG